MPGSSSTACPSRLHILFNSMCFPSPTCSSPAVGHQPISMHHAQLAALRKARLLGTALHVPHPVWNEGTPPSTTTHLIAAGWRLPSSGPREGTGALSNPVSPEGEGIRCAALEALENSTSCRQYPLLVTSPGKEGNPSPLPSPLHRNGRLTSQAARPPEEGLVLIGRFKCSSQCFMKRPGECG